MGCDHQSAPSLNLAPNAAEPHKFSCKPLIPELRENIQAQAKSRLSRLIMQCHICEEGIPQSLFIGSHTAHKAGDLPGFSVLRDKDLIRDQPGELNDRIHRDCLIGRKTNAVDLSQTPPLIRARRTEAELFEHILVRVYVKQDLRVLKGEDPRKLRHFEAVHEQHALAHEDVEHVAGAAVQRLIVGLSFGDHHIGVNDRFPRLPGKIAQHRSVCSCPVSHAVADLRESDLLRVLHGGVICHRRSPQDHGDRNIRVHAQDLAEQYFVHDDLAAVVRDQHQCTRAAGHIPELFKTFLIHRDIRRPADQFHEPGLLHIVERGKIYEIAHHRILYRALKRIL